MSDSKSSKPKNSQGPLSRRLDGVSESATLKLNATVQAMKARGEDVINLTAGEPDFNVPDAAKEAVIESLQKNRSKYTPAPGITELREAIAAKTNAQQPEVVRSQAWKAANVIVTNGGKQALFNSMLALLDPGDEVLIPTPYWLSYPEMVKLAGGIPKFIPSTLANQFKIQPEQLKNALSSKVKILILNSPSNPTGSLYSKAEFAALAEVIQSTPGAENTWVVSDEIYDRIILGDTPFCSFLNAAPGLRDRTVTVNGMSKSAAMTGWRIGWSVAPENVTQGMITLQGQSTSGINSLAQWASLAALKLPDSYFEQGLQIYRKRCKLMLEILRKARKIEVMAPEGAFYVFIGVKDYMRAGEDSIAFAQRVLEEAKVALVPGTPFGEPEFLRLSFATDEQSIQNGCERLVKYLEK
ncbi:MAG: pyridoxal phosphate-dependent aminotransferase [Bdellovibrio sp.]|nr:pyridoxal phosphate-dependent aminotransferase [Bdellovibrio sp.]